MMMKRLRWLPRLTRKKLWTLWTNILEISMPKWMKRFLLKLRIPKSISTQLRKKSGMKWVRFKAGLTRSEELAKPFILSKCLKINRRKQKLKPHSSTSKISNTRTISLMKSKDSSTTSAPLLIISKFKTKLTNRTFPWWELTKILKIPCWPTETKIALLSWIKNAFLAVDFLHPL